MACRLSHLFCRISVCCVSIAIVCSMSSILAFFLSRDVCAATRFFSFLRRNPALESNQTGSRLKTYFLWIFSSHVKWSSLRFFARGQSPEGTSPGGGTAGWRVLGIGLGDIATYFGTVIKIGALIFTDSYSPGRLETQRHYTENILMLIYFVATNY